MKTAGYSKTPLARKLGYKPGYKVLLLNTPDYYFELFSEIPEDIDFSPDKGAALDLIHIFSKEYTMLEESILKLKNKLKQSGTIWISWPKRAAKVETDLDGNLVRAIGLKSGLVDIKVCAIDKTWSGLKFVIPVKDRNK